MENKPPGEDVENVVAMPSMSNRLSGADPDWNEMLSRLAESKDKTLYIALFRHFAPRVKSYLIRLGLVDTVAEELMQETMLAVWRKSHLYNSSKAAASTWIFTLARNKSIDLMRKQKYPEYDLEEWQEEPDHQDSPCEQGVVSERMNSAINTLPENQAQVIYMSFFEGRSHADISDRLGVPLGSVKSRIRLASEKLKTMWRDGV
ncbi:sigma-70 family RNA polymerase sigma factor [Neptuniibacter marinus]|uniref:sigma-70 family RNA polymerase sigma factor n=1 Tax=Neptuniibacter marinus TaxID=1806670 RepID=UPI00082CCC6D|nr:sigma-70 family RNA polymerase sigma factor [Neptuniibacter marinus]